MITLHYLENSRAQRIAWLLEELGADYRSEIYRRRPSLQAPKALRQVHPLGKSPVLEDGDLVLAESGAIVEYLLARHGGEALRPAPDSPDFPAYLHYMHAAEGTAMPLLVNRLVFSRVPSMTPALIRPIARRLTATMDAKLVAPQLPPLFDDWQRALSATGWFAGDFSAADVMMSYPVQAAVARAGAAEGRPALADFVARIESRPAWARAMEKGAFAML